MYPAFLQTYYTFLCRLRGSVFLCILFKSDIRTRLRCECNCAVDFIHVIRKDRDWTERGQLFIEYFSLSTEEETKKR